MRKFILRAMMIAIWLCGCGKDEAATVLPEIKVMAPVKQKQVVISEVPMPGSQFEGRWLVFVHYSDSSLTAEIEVDSQGRSLTSTEALTEGLLFSVNEDGSIQLVNERMSARCTVGEDLTYLSGNATIDDRGLPVPVSVRRISAAITESGDE